MCYFYCVLQLGKLLNNNPGLKVSGCFNVFCVEMVSSLNVLHNLTSGRINEEKKLET